MVADIEMGGKRITLVNVYGPNKDDPQFYKKIQDIIEDFGNVSVITSGDWNLVLDYTSDTRGYLHKNNPDAQKQVLQTKDELGLIDPWRAANEGVSRFTWRSAGPIIKQSRLDFFLISDDVYNQVTKANIRSGYKTDHSIVTLKIKISNFKQGRGFWKLNVSLLNDEEYVRKVKQTLKDTVEQYKKDDQAEDKPIHEVELSIDDQLFWEVLKMEMRRMSMFYGNKKKKEREKEEAQIERQINQLETDLVQTPTIEKKEQLEERKKQLEKIREPIVRAMMIRSRAQWVELGERPTQYFCNLEKRNVVNLEVP